jgi:hypothetical protein
MFETGVCLPDQIDGRNKGLGKMFLQMLALGRHRALQCMYEAYQSLIGGSRVVQHEEWIYAHQIWTRNESCLFLPLEQAIVLFAIVVVFGLVLVLMQMVPAVETDACQST